jgi:hypothetical protein
VDYDRWFESGLEQARAVIDSLNLSPSISEARIAEAVDRVIFARLRHHVSKQDAIYSPTVAKFYSLLRQAAIDGKTSDEIWTITETFEKAGDLLSIWDALVIEGNETIANNKNLLKKQKKCLRCSYAIIIVFLVLFIIYAFTLGGAHNWFK